MIKKRNIGRNTLAQDLGHWLEFDVKSGLANAFAFAEKNPYNDKDLFIDEVILHIKTAGGTGSSVLDVDVTTSATGTGDTIFDGVDLNSTGVYSSRTPGDTGTNGNEKIKIWNKAGGTNDFLTGKILVANASNLVGKVYVRVREVK